MYGLYYWAGSIMTVVVVWKTASICHPCGGAWTHHLSQKPGLALGMDGLDGIMGCVISMPVPASHFPPHRSYFERSKIVFKVSQIAYKDFFIAASYI
jgi:hypothetical protein